MAHIRQVRGDAVGVLVAMQALDGLGDELCSNHRCHRLCARGLRGPARYGRVAGVILKCVRIYTMIHPPWMCDSPSVIAVSMWYTNSKGTGGQTGPAVKSGKLGLLAFVFVFGPSI